MGPQEKNIRLIFRIDKPVQEDVKVKIPIHDGKFTMQIYEQGEKIQENITVVNESNYKKEIDQVTIGPERWSYEVIFKSNFKYASFRTMMVQLQQDGFVTKGSLNLWELFGTKARSKRIFMLDQEKGIRCRVRIACKEIIHWHQRTIVMDWKASQIPSKFLSHSNPYLKFLKINQDDTYSEVGRTEVIRNSSTPDWKKKKISLQQLIDPKNALPAFQVQCWHHEQKEEDNDELIGEARVEIEKLKAQTNENADIFRISDPETNKSYGQLLMTQKAYETPHTFLSITEGAIFFFIAGINIKNRFNLQMKIECAAKMVEKAWQIIEPSAKYYPFFALNIAANLDQSSQQSNCPTKYSEEQFQNQSPNLTPNTSTEGQSQNIPQKQSKRKKPIHIQQVNKMMFFKNRFKYEGVEDLHEDMKHYYQKNEKDLSEEEESLLRPFLLQAEKINPPQSINKFFYKIILIITDSKFRDIQESVFQMIIDQYPVSFFIAQIGAEEDLDEYHFFNRKYLQSFNEQYESDRPLSRFNDFNVGLQKMQTFISQFLSPIPDHLLEYYNKIEKRLLCHSPEENQKISQQIERARRSSNTCQSEIQNARMSENSRKSD